eukprot:scaffold8291_cov64-Phaeocystis_antarctica.AAC.2
MAALPSLRATARSWRLATLTVENVTATYMHIFIMLFKKQQRRRLLAKKQQLFNIAAPAASTFNGSA